MQRKLSAKSQVLVCPWTSHACGHTTILTTLTHPYHAHHLSNPTPQLTHFAHHLFSLYTTCPFFTTHLTHSSLYTICYSYPPFSSSLSNILTPMHISFVPNVYLHGHHYHHILNTTFLSLPDCASCT